MAFTGAATVVVANIFQLVDINGNIVGSLGNGPGGVALPGNGPFSTLAMKHLDPVTSDSSLSWTQNGATGTEAVRLEGPVSAAGAEDNRPQITLYRSAQGPNPTTGLTISSGRPDGANTNPLGPYIAMQNDTTVPLETFEIGGNNITVHDSNFASRGQLYGLTQQSASPASVLLTNVAQTLCTVVVANCPTPGAWLDIFWSVYFEISAVGANYSQYDCLVNGVLQPKRILHLNSVALGVVLSQRMFVAAPINIGAFNVVIRGFKTSALATVNTFTADSNCTVATYR